MSRNEHGAGTVSGLLWVCVLLVLGMTCVLAVGVVTTHRRAQAAADLSALAGAQAQQRGGGGCAAASEVAGRNRGAVESCRRHGRDVLVVVVVEAPAIFGRDFLLRARARAGPVGLGDTGLRDLTG